MSFMKLSASVLTPLLISTQLAMAAPPTESDTSVTPEVQLLESVIALQGSKLPSDQLQEMMRASLSDYLASAPADGRDARLESALVSLGIYTPSQAQKFDSEVQTATSNMTSSHFASSQQEQEALQKQLMNIANASNGAQFSACGIAAGGVAVGLGAMITAGVMVYFTPIGNTNSPLPENIAYGGLAVIGAAFVTMIIVGGVMEDCD